MCSSQAELMNPQLYFDKQTAAREAAKQKAVDDAVAKQKAESDAQLAAKDQTIGLYEDQQAQYLGTNKDVMTSGSTQQALTNKSIPVDRNNVVDDQEQRMLLSGAGDETEQRGRRLRAQSNKRSLLGA